MAKMNLTIHQPIYGKPNFFHKSNLIRKIFLKNLKSYFFAHLTHARLSKRESSATQNSRKMSHTHKFQLNKFVQLQH